MPKRERRTPSGSACGGRNEPAAVTPGRRPPPPSTAFKRGRAFEWRVRDHLTGLGYIVSRSPRSLGPFDLLAAGLRTEVLLIECKAGGYLPPSKWNLLFALARSHFCVPVLVIRHRRKIVYYELTSVKIKGGPQPMKQFFPARASDGEQHMGSGAG